jgi:pyrroloquinoline quinone biosynthesis protein B
MNNILKISFFFLLIISLPFYSQSKLIVLGTVQDAGSPHIACSKECCKDLFENPDPTRRVASLGIVDSENNQSWIIDATPDLPIQMKLLKNQLIPSAGETPDGIFLTHAHIGHYSGLVYLGKEAMNSKSIPVYAMPKMKLFIERNGPWDQLVKLENIKITELENERTLELSSNISITPVLVPHRDEYSETVGFIICGPNRKALFVPDIDKWDLWNKDIVEEVKKVDYALIDATFYDGDEVNNRDISESPHPFVIESMNKFKDLTKKEKNKIYFIHFNHTNPLLNPESKQSKFVIKQGFNIAGYKLELPL